MKKLWIFGDSYGIPYNTEKKLIDWHWSYTLGQKLKVSQYINSSEVGSSNDYTVDRILNYKDNISKHDYVIIISTSIIRRWLLKDKPWVSNFNIGNLNTLMSQHEKNAVNDYIKHLNNSMLDIMLYNQFLGWVHYMTDLHKWNVLVVPGFEEKGYPVSHKYSVSGSLFDVCENEFKSKQDREWFYSNQYVQGFDRRLGHIIKDNHDVLSNKIYDTFVFNKPLDLTYGFKTNIIGRDNINEIEDQLIN